MGATRKNSRKKSPRNSVSSSILYGLWLCLFLGAGSALGWIAKSPLLAGLLGSALQIRKVEPKQAFGKSSVTLLILGCDEDLVFKGVGVLKHKSRSDMMLLTKLDFVNNRVTGLSIPRDIRVKYPGQPAHKINAFHAIAPWGKEDEYTKRAVEFLLPGIHIDKVVTLDFGSFDAMVNSIGGVSLTIDRTMNYDDNAGNVHVHFKPGPAMLDGYQAEMYVRYRHGDSDFERQKRQREFLIAFKDAILRKPTMLPSLMEQSKKVLGDSLTNDQMIAMMDFSRKLPHDRIVMNQIPVKDGRGTWQLLLKDQAKQMLHQYGFVSNDPTHETAER